MTCPSLFASCQSPVAVGNTFPLAVVRLRSASSCSLCPCVATAQPPAASPGGCRHWRAPGENYCPEDRTVEPFCQWCQASLLNFFFSFPILCFGHSACASEAHQGNCRTHLQRVSLDLLGGLSGLVSFYDYQQGTHISKLFQQLNILYIYRTFLL